MATRTATPLGAPVWVDLGTSDIAGAQAFYSTVFGWTLESPGPDYGGYINAQRDGRYVGGMMANDPEWNAPDAWTVYLHTADIHATVAAAVAAGATNCVPPMEVPDKGWMAILTDPTGAPIGLWQPTGHVGFEAYGEAGTPVWFQLTTTDFAAATAFYTSVFGWQLQVEADSDEFRYSNAIFDGIPLIGVMDGSVLPGLERSTWNCFWGSDDVDKTIEVITSGGGSVVRAAEDTPYGRLAAVTDATGAAFNLSSYQA
ncbi:putative enzyme related to lactoylglutathione lyase [Mycobacterium sp. MAA66]|uniref:VOC family protein n=1 Tax=Mycobacterium sp. MAA66 TaxID=3156297 RepID=UPI0035148969